MVSKGSINHLIRDHCVGHNNGREHENEYNVDQMGHLMSGTIRNALKGAHERGGEADNWFMLSSASPNALSESCEHTMPFTYACTCLRMQFPSWQLSHKGDMSGRCLDPAAP